MRSDFKNYLLKVTRASSCEEVEIIQSLWSGYGKISRYQLMDSAMNTVVVKCISPSPSKSHPRGWNTDNSHRRKVKSYEVETYWYEKWNQLCSDNCRVPTFIGSFTERNDQYIILEDLNAHFPIRKYQIDLSEVKVCLKWLANFHMTFLAHVPTGLWKIGTYWNLGTRPDEYEKIENETLKSKAHIIDELLNKCKFQTIVHGDAKLANFCFSENGERVAAVDFQYVGGGCGIKDVAYFLGSCLSSEYCELYESELLHFYFSELRKAVESTTKNIDFSALEHEWRNMYPIACTDFIRFLMGWMPDHQKVNDYNIKIMERVLASL